MTREEAIKKIKSLCHDCVEFPHCVNTDPDCFKALEIAIQALEQIDILKEAYNKGYKDGQEAIAFHLELCKDEGSIIEIPEGSTNGDVYELVFGGKPIDDFEEWKGEKYDNCD